VRSQTFAEHESTSDDLRSKSITQTTHSTVRQQSKTVEKYMLFFFDNPNWDTSAMARVNISKTIDKNITKQSPFIRVLC